MNLLEINNVVKQYSGQLALNDVSLIVPRGSVYGLLGPNGAGKTTLIRIINCITAPDSGEILLNGKKLTPADVRNIGYLPEERGLYKKMKVGEQAMYLARLKGMTKHDATKALKYWFEKFEIQDWWNKKVEELSKGMAQKVQFITTILHNPDLLIFDEPFSGFDPVNTELLKKELLDLKAKGKTIILSTHNMESVEELCDEISLINKSRVVLNGNVKEIRARYRKHIFKLQVVGETFDLESSHFSILSQSTDSNITELLIQRNDEASNSELIQEIAKRYEVVTFEEVLPSMNDIFIQIVSETKQ